MGKLVAVGYTDYFDDGQVRQVRILSYDNNKYVQVQTAEGDISEVKRGYIFADPALTRRIAAVHWHVHGGGKRHTYKRRQHKTEYRAYCEGAPLGRAHERRFGTKAEALVYAKRRAMETQQEVIVDALCRNKNSYSSGMNYVVCNRFGYAVEYNAMKRRRPGKYLRGYGKMLHQRAFR